jgi:hypothetical protein
MRLRVMTHALLFGDPLRDIDPFNVVCCDDYYY